jgi:hypothetical protein
MAKKPVLIGLIVLMISLAFPVKFARACSCVPPPSDREAMTTTDAVFSGTVIEIDDPEGGGPVISSGRQITYTFDVDGIAKGDVAADERVTSAADGVSCGADFADGGRYVVFADKDEKGDLTTSLCSNNHVLRAGQEIEFAATHDPDPADGEGQPSEDVPAIAWMGVGTVVFLGAASIVLSRRRKNDG